MTRALHRVARVLLALLVIWPFVAVGEEIEGSLTPTYLRCEARVGPLGLTQPTPRLSWVVESNQRNQVQSAYQVLAATHPDRLKPGEADLWDSGKVDRDDTLGVAYAGKALVSHQLVYWSVRVWDGKERPSAWASPAHWSMGLLKPADFQARWIGFDRHREPIQSEAPFGEAKWIAHRSDGASPPAGHRLYVTSFQVPADAGVEEATLHVAADDAFKFTINGGLVAQGEGFTNVYESNVLPHLKSVNTVRVEVENKQAGPTGLIARLVVRLKGGHEITKITDGTWRTLQNPGANWHDRVLDTRDWPAAAVVGAHGDAPWGKLKYASIHLPPPSYLRKSFTIERAVRRATLYAASLGLADLYLNGSLVNQDRFGSGWTDYTKRVEYRAYDVTRLLDTGANVVGAILADGWYSGYVGFGRQRNHYGSRPRLWAQLHVEYDDGGTSDISTGPDWSAATGPIREADFLMGETYDARRELGPWSTVKEPGAGWSPVDVGAEVSPRIEWHPGPEVVDFGTVVPRQTRQQGKNTYVFDMGQNFAGVVRLRVRGNPGQKITLRFAERLNPDGSIYTTNLRSARCLDTYICRGGGEEVWEPRFTFHGFQYVEVQGLTQPPTPETITGLALSSDTPLVGSFHCSDPMLNQLHSNILWTQRANFIDIPTDCPQRDERLGWTGDAQVYVRAATLNTDVQSFFTKWLIDLVDGQRPDGQFPMVAPVKVAGDDGGPAWADAGVICPWTLFLVYGDRALLERQYSSMVKFIEFCRKRSVDGVLPPPQYHAFGDWLSIKADTPKDVIYTAYYAHSTQLTARAAEVLGKAEDARTYNALFERIKAAFNKAFVMADGRIQGETQAVYVLALAFDLLDADQAKAAARHLLADIRSKNHHLSTGFIGTKDLMLVLSKIGATDVAYRLLHNTSFPSWGFSIEHGATSIWERWDGWTPENGFQDPGMNSFAHYSFGAVYQWMVENIGGILADAPSYRSVTVAPVIDPKLTHAEVSYNSVRGLIGSRWSRSGDGTLNLDAIIPANTMGRVVIPAPAGATVEESGVPLAEVKGLRVVEAEGGKVTVKVGSGHYRFKVSPRN